MFVETSNFLIYLVMLNFAYLKYWSTIAMKFDDMLCLLLHYYWAIFCVQLSAPYDFISYFNTKTNLTMGLYVIFSSHNIYWVFSNPYCANIFDYLINAHIKNIFFVKLNINDQKVSLMKKITYNIKNDDTIERKSIELICVTTICAELIDKQKCVNM